METSHPADCGQLSSYPPRLARRTAGGGGSGGGRRRRPLAGVPCVENGGHAASRSQVEADRRDLPRSDVILGAGSNVVKLESVQCLGQTRPHLSPPLVGKHRRLAVSVSLHIP